MGCMPSKHHPLPLKAGKLGVIRLDYDYPPAPGDIDSQLSFDYQVVYRVVPGLTFDVCQSGQLTDEVKVQLDQAINDLIDEEHVHGKPRQGRDLALRLATLSHAATLSQDSHAPSCIYSWGQASRATAAS